MAVRKWQDIKKAKLSTEQITRIGALVKADVFEMELRDLRAEAGLTQSELAPEADMTQAALSRFEDREDHLVSKLRQYIEALGGKLEVAAVFGNKRITLRGV